MTTAEQQATVDSSTLPIPVTRVLAESGRRVRYDDLPADVVTRAKQCVLDWLGVTLTGSGEPLARILRDEAREQGGHEQATLIGSGGRVATQQAALVNGAASHALDYDDVHAKMSGHPTVPVLPALLALAEWQGRSGRDLIAAFIAGFETECRLGTVVMPGHYGIGWHSTATLGTFGAAAGCAHLLGLDLERWQHALGIAGTQAAGMKSMFGTMCKPLHAGKAAANGLFAATLARRGFTSNPEVVETAQGFAATHTPTYSPERIGDESADAYAIRDVLFKYHAACYGTHATIDGLLRLKEQHGVQSGDVESVTLHVPVSALSMCNIQEPATALEGKFSLRFTAALALGHGDATEQAFTDERVREPTLVALRDRVQVYGDEGVPGFVTEVVLQLADGRELRESANVNTPESDLDRQWQRLEAKFRSLAGPVVGEGQAERLLALVRDLDRVDDVREITSLTTPSA
ncbi:MAG: MmgE/PrpD family protein [Dehalococcoidia bacterium]